MNQKASTSQIIAVKNLWKSFAKTSILENINIEVNQGDVYALLGPNGSGKTTTLRLLLGLIEPTKGKILIFNQEIQHLTPDSKRKVSAVLDNHGLYDNLTVYQNLKYFAQIYRLPDDEINKIIDERLSWVDMQTTTNLKIKKLSKGMKQRIALARSLLNDPSLLFLDEPTAGLDIEATVQIRELLIKLAQQNKTTIFITSHDLDEIERFASHVCLLNHGKIISQGTLPALQAQFYAANLDLYFQNDINITVIQQDISSLPFVTHTEILADTILRVKLNDEEKQPDLINFCASRGIRIREARQDNTTLEDIYLSLVKDAENA